MKRYVPGSTECQQARSKGTTRLISSFAAAAKVSQSLPSPAAAAISRLARRICSRFTGGRVRGWCRRRHPIDLGGVLARNPGIWDMRCRPARARLS